MVHETVNGEVNDKKNLTPQRRSFELLLWCLSRKIECFAPHHRLTLTGYS